MADKLCTVQAILDHSVTSPPPVMSVQFSDRSQLLLTISDTPCTAFPGWLFTPATATQMRWQAPCGLQTMRKYRLFLI